MSEYFNKQGDVISREKWMDLYADDSYQQVANTKLDNGTLILTVWMGIPHSYGSNGPVIFETVLFDAESKDEEIYRYATEEGALKHHAHLVDTYYDEHEPISRWKQVAEEL